jgi:hypothetical protein
MKRGRGDAEVSTERVMVLSWLLQNSGQFGDMHDSDSERGLYVSAVDLIALGINFARNVSDDYHTLKSLQQCLGSAIKMVTLAIQVAGDECDGRKLSVDTEGLEMATDLRESVLDVLCAGWAVMPNATHLQPSRVRVLSSLLSYAAQQHEPALAGDAIRLILVLCQSAERDSEIVHAFLYDCSAAQRYEIRCGLAGWLQACLSTTSGSADEGVDVAELVLRMLLRSIDTLQATADKHGCEPVLVVQTPEQYGENLAVALLGLYQDHHLHHYQDHQGGSHILLEMLLNVIREHPWSSISHLEINLPKGIGSAHTKVANTATRADACAYQDTCPPGVGDRRHSGVYQLSHDCMHIIFTLGVSGILPIDMTDTRREEGMEPTPVALHMLEATRALASTLEGFKGEGCLWHWREELKNLRAGHWLGEAAGPEIRLLFGEGLVQFSSKEALGRWQRGAEVMAHILPPPHADALIESYLAARTRILEVEELLEEAVEGHLLFLQQNGWFLRSLAVLIQHTDSCTIRRLGRTMPENSMAAIADGGAQRDGLVGTNGGGTGGQGSKQTLSWILGKVLGEQARQSAAPASSGRSASHCSLSPVRSISSPFNSLLIMFISKYLRPSRFLLKFIMSKSLARPISPSLPPSLPPSLSLSLSLGSSPRSKLPSPRTRAGETDGGMGVGSWRGGLLHEVVAHVLSMHALEGQAGWKADNECVHPSLSPQVHASFFYVQA